MAIDIKTTAESFPMSIFNLQSVIVQNPHKLRAHITRIINLTRYCLDYFVKALNQDECIPFKLFHRLKFLDISEYGTVVNNATHIA
jgi:hypothetical protein